MMALENWRDRHVGETVIVCGCGTSLKSLTSKPPCTVIGVNDMSRQFEPDYLVVLNPERQFSKARFSAIRDTQAKAVFTSVTDLDIPVANVVRFALGKRGGTSVSAKGRLPYTRNSPYVALALALFMGARRIGLIGVDFTSHHFFGATGTHPLAREIRAINREFGQLADANPQADIVNLSRESQLTALKKVALEPFIAALKPKRRVLHISSTNCAGAIWNLHRLMNADGRLESRVATASSRTRSTSMSRTYPQDISWRDTSGFHAAIERADILHFHNFVDAQSPALAPFAKDLAKKPAVLQVHSEPAVLKPHFPGRDPSTRKDIPVLVIAQKHARFYPNAKPVLNALIPQDFSVVSERSQPPRVVFTPTDLADYPAAQPTCRGKGYKATKAVLSRLEREGCLRASIQTSICFEAAMRLSAGASAKIDECVTGGYHLTSLEALSQGLAAIAWLDPETRRLLCEMSGSDDSDLPWISVRMPDLEETLRHLVKQPDALAKAGALGRTWMQKHWTPEAVLDPIFEVYNKLGTPHAPRRRKESTKRAGTGYAHLRRSSGGALLGHKAGQKHLKRSEDYPQTFCVTPSLLADQGRFSKRIVHVLGNGPSLGQTDLAHLTQDCVIGVNTAADMARALGRPLDYYCISDRRFLSTEEGRNLADQARSAKRVFAGYCSGFIEDPDINYLRVLPGDGISADVLHGVHHCCSVVLFAAQLALWLGAKDIRLHGMECDYSKGRFGEKPGSPMRPHDSGIYPRIANCAKALAQHLSERNGTLSVVGPSRLTGAFGSAAVPGIYASPLTETSAASDLQAVG